MYVCRMDQYYYVFGFLLLVYIILAITCAEITTVLCYFQLCSEVRSTRRAFHILFFMSLLYVSYMSDVCTVCMSVFVTVCMYVCMYA